MSISFTYKEGDNLKHYASIPRLPIIPKSHVICVNKSIGLITFTELYLKRIGKVTRIISPLNSEHLFWEIQHTKDYIIPSFTDTIVMVFFPRLGEELFLPKDIVHLAQICTN